MLRRANSIFSYHVEGGRDISSSVENMPCDKSRNISKGTKGTELLELLPVFLDIPRLQGRKLAISRPRFAVVDDDCIGVSHARMQHDSDEIQPAVAGLSECVLRHIFEKEIVVKT